MVLHRDRYSVAIIFFKHVGLNPGATSIVATQTSSFSTMALDDADMDDWFDFCESCTLNDDPSQDIHPSHQSGFDEPPEDPFLE